MAKKLALVAAVVFTVAVLGFVYFSPHWTLKDMRAAARSGDGAELAEHVDFPAVRQSLKAELRKTLEARAEISGGAGPFGALGAAFAGAMLDPMVEALVTPESLALMLQGIRPQPGQAEPLPLEDSVEVSSEYEGFGTFVVTIQRKDGGTPPIGLVLSRDKLFFWKLTAVRLP